MTEHIVPEPTAPYNPTPTPEFNTLRAQLAGCGVPIAQTIGPGECLIPSASRPGVKYYVALMGPQVAFCTCPNGGVDCWHVARARQLTHTLIPCTIAPTMCQIREQQIARGYVALGSLPEGSAFEDAAHRRGVVGRPCSRTARYYRITWDNGLRDSAAANYLVKRVDATGQVDRWLPTATVRERAAAAYDDLFGRPAA